MAAVYKKSYLHFISFSSFYRTLLVFIFFISFYNTAFSQPATKPNIVFIIMDDLNDYVKGFNGQPQVETPTLRMLENMGTTFVNAYNSAPQCAPSRTSFLTGKDLFYTQVYHNDEIKCKVFRDNFTPAKGNEEVFTIPQVLKDSGGYFTYSINKVFHCTQNAPDYDSLTADPCAKNLSWNKIINYPNGETPSVQMYGNSVNEGVNGFNFAPIPNDMETQMEDYTATDSAIAFINDYASNPGNYCDRPFFLALGYRRPHGPLYIPEKYFSDNYLYDIYAEPFNKPYNDPVGAFPYNGVVMPPQPDPMWSDYDALPVNGVARALIDESDVNGAILNYAQYLQTSGLLPEIDPGLTDDERTLIIAESKRANAVLAYMAAIKYMDTQIGRFYESMQDYPDILNNTVFILVGDNGYSLGEKTHWRKGCLWETDIRIPFIITDMRTQHKQIVRKFVSLLDLFPTIADIGSTPYPLFSDGSNYLDGFSLTPLLANPNLSWKRPLLTTFRNTIVGAPEGHCFPQYSVRTDEWHLIEYRTNGTEDGTCNEATSVLQKELYHIGKRKNIDPYEWNNLAANPAYNDLISYLETYLPGNENYLQFGKLTDIYLNNDDITIDDNQLQIFPNPARDIINITLDELPQIAELNIYNTTGNIVKKIKLSEGTNQFQQYSIDISALSDGIYFAVIETGTSKYSASFAVIK